jgi:hypothetical protein
MHKNKKLKCGMSVDFGCIETCIFPDFEDYVEPFEDEGMSEEEEDYLDYLLGDDPTFTHICRDAANRRLCRTTVT